MKKLLFLIGMVMLMSNLNSESSYGYESDSFETSGEKLTITFIGHGSLMIEFKTLVIHVDPYSRMADYSRLPKADVILITHGHQDHYDMNAIKKITKPATDIVSNPAVGENYDSATVMKNGESRMIKDISIEAVPAYNTTDDRLMFHPKGRDNGYVLTLGDLKIYIAGDTEAISEMSALKNIDIAFLPVNQPYTMTPDQAAEAALMFKPSILYPYHYGETEITDLAELLKGEPIEVRIRKLQ